jgi:hypothetical protein
MPSAKTAPRRIAVVLDGPGTPRWQQRALAALSSSPRLEVVEVRLARARRRGLARRGHEALERRLFALGPGALTPVVLDESQLRAANGPADPGAELVVWLSESPLPPEERRSVLYLCHGGRREPAEEAFRRAVLRGEACVETEALERSAQSTLLVERTVSAARPYSTTLSRDKALWKIAALVARAAVRAPGLAAAPSEPVAPTPAPSTAELLARSPWRWLRIVLARALFDRRWRLRLRSRGASPAAGWAQQEPFSARWLPGHLYADPCLFEHEGRHHLFCEDLPPGGKRAVIAHLELDATEAAPVPVLQAEHHLSYPFVFAHADGIFMIPETSAERRVELYRAVEFPGVWSLEAVLLDGLIASDATVLEHGGRLWLFAGVAEPGATMLDELHLFSAETLRGPWQAHPRNPIVSDVRCARPAGAIQRWGDRLIRPAQDCSRRYGGAVSFRAIDILTPEDYGEHEIARIDPGDLGGGARAVHTYSADSRFEAVDLRRRELRLGRLFASSRH